MRRYILCAIGLVLLLTHHSTAQDAVAVPMNPAPGVLQNVEVDVLIACVVFDEKGELTIEKEGAEPEVNRAGTIGANLAAKLNDEKSNLPAGVSPATAGANLLMQGLGDTDSLESLARLQLRMVLGGGESRIQIGHSKPRITGATSQGTRRVNSITMENMGTLVEGSAHAAESGRIQLALKIERSAFAPEEEGTVIAKNDDVSIRTPATKTMTLQTTLTAAAGETVVIGNHIESNGDRVKETLVLLTPILVKP